MKVTYWVLRFCIYILRITSSPNKAGTSFEAGMTSCARQAGSDMPQVTYGVSSLIPGSAPVLLVPAQTHDIVYK